MNKWFTGQDVIGDTEDVMCSKCEERINLRNNAWFDAFNDPHNKGGSYVHYKCLSQQRLDEIAQRKLENEH